MAEGFWSGLNQHLLFWSGWVFTVGGAIAGLWIGREYGWITALCVVVGLMALTTFAYQKHKQLRKERQEHQTRISQLEADLRAARERAENAERKINEIPADILLQLRAVIQSHSFQALAALLADHAGYVARMVNLDKLITKPIPLRTFAKRAGRLFVDAKVNAAAMGLLRQDDPFRLEFKSANTLVTASAFLRVHQLDAAKELIWFRVEAYSGDEMAHIDGLAEKQEVPGKGYTARPVSDLARYAHWDLANAAAIIRTLIDEITRLQG